MTRVRRWHRRRWAVSLPAFYRRGYWEMHTTYMCWDAAGRCAGWFFAPGTPGHEGGVPCECECHRRASRERT